MDILNSTWFLRMLKKAGASPQERMLALFDILGDWLDAPHISRNLKVTRSDHDQPQALLEYLTEQAAATGAQDHEFLAQQLCFMASSVLHEELRNPGCAAAKHGRRVAQALIQAQTQKDHSISKRSAYAIAASVFMLTAVGSLLIFTMAKPPVVSIAANAAMTKPAALLVNPEAASPEQTAAMFATLEQMRQGTCQFPEALMLPETQKGVYMENVVAGHVPSKAKDQEVAGQLMLKVRCNYTPRLMANSTG